MKIKLREKNPVPIGIIGVLILAGSVFGAFNITKLPIFAGTTYKAAFAESGDLQSGDLVRVAGVDVGEVQDVSLDGPQVMVTFGLKHVRLGDRSTAAIKTQTLLGKRFLEIAPQGQGSLPGDSVIPLSRTTSPYNVDASVEDLGRELKNLNTAKLGNAVGTFADAIQTTPQSFPNALQGLTRISQTINNRDQALLDLLGNAGAVTGILRDRSNQISQLANDGDSLLGELQARREVIHRLLGDTNDALEQVRGVVGDNNKQIGPVLDHFNAVITNLRQHEGNLNQVVKTLGPFAQNLGDVIGSGPYFSAQVPNLTPPGDLAPLYPYVGGPATVLPPLGPNPSGAPTPGQLATPLPKTLVPQVPPAPKGLPTVPGLLDREGGN